MLQPFYNEQSVTVGGETFRLVIDFEAIDATESLLGGRSYDLILDELLSPHPSKGLQTRVIWGMLRTHHPGTTLEQAHALTEGAAGIAVGGAVTKLIQAAFPLQVEPKEKGKNPPKPRGASKPSSKRGPKRG